MTWFGDCAAKRPELVFEGTAADGLAAAATRLTCIREAVWTNLVSAFLANCAVAVAVVLALSATAATVFSATAAVFCAVLWMTAATLALAVGATDAVVDGASALSSSSSSPVFKPRSLANGFLKWLLLATWVPTSTPEPRALAIELSDGLLPRAWISASATA